MPAVRLIKKPALAAEVPDPGCLEMKACAELYGYSTGVGPETALTGHSSCCV